MVGVQVKIEKISDTAVAWDILYHCLLSVTVNHFGPFCAIIQNFHHLSDFSNNHAKISSDIKFHDKIVPVSFLSNNPDMDVACMVNANGT